MRPSPSPSVVACLRVDCGSPSFRVAGCGRTSSEIDAARCATYYFFDIAGGNWFDNAHRVDVRWLKPEADMFTPFMVPEIGGTWIRGLGPVKGGSERLVRLAGGLLSAQANTPLQPTSGGSSDSHFSAGSGQSV